MLIGILSLPRRFSSLLAPLFSTILFLAALPCSAQPSTYQFIYSLATGSPAGNYVPANQTFISPGRLALDPAGNVYFSEGEDIRMIAASGLVVPVAGNGAGCCGVRDGEPALLAAIAAVGGVGIDPSGTVWFTDGATLRRISSAGTVQTVAPFGGSLALDSTGNLYVAGKGIQKVSPNGNVTQYPNTNSLTNTLGGIAVDSFGAVYIANSNTHVVQKVTPAGVVTTLAGNGTAGDTGDNGPAVDAEIDFPDGMAVDAAGNIYFTDYNRGVVRKVSTGGTITTVAGGGATFGEGGPAAQAVLNHPVDVTIDKAGNLYIAESGYFVAPENPFTSLAATLTGAYIRKVTTDGNIHTLAGQLSSGCCGDGGPLSQAFFPAPSGLARDSQGNIYVADALQHTVRRIAADLTVTTIAGSGLAGYAGDNGPAAAAILDTPQGVAVDGAGNIYIADSGNNRIRMVSADGNIATIAGNGLTIFTGDGGPATLATLSGPDFVLADGSGNLFIADTGHHRVRKVTPDGKIQTIAGDGTVGFAGDNGPATAAQLSTPQSLAIDRSGNLYIADDAVDTIRKVSPSGIITTFAGTPGQLGYAGDGSPATHALLNLPCGVAVDGSGKVWIADSANGAIREVTPYGVISSPQDGIGAVLAVLPDPSGNVYYATGGRGPTALGYLYMGANPLPPFAPVVPWAGIVNAGVGQRGGAVAPGMIASMTGNYLGPEQGVTAAPNSSGDFSNLLAGVQVFFNNVAAPMIYSQAQKVEFVVPFEVAGMSTVNIHLEYNGVHSNSNTLPVTPTFPGVLGVVNEDGILNVNEPTSQGSIVGVFATGGGQTNPGEVDGVPVSGTLPLLLAPVQATIRYITGSQVSVVPAPVLYAGPAPTEVAGVLQVNVQIPPLPGLSVALSSPAPILTMYVGGAAASIELNIE
jgi:uncharacterized protein (TIGR03437 family)